MTRRSFSLTGGSEAPATMADSSAHFDEPFRTRRYVSIAPAARSFIRFTRV
jgi:hypothetical protein